MKVNLVNVLKISQNLIHIELNSIIIPWKCELHSTCFLSCSKFYILGFDIWASFPSSGKVHVLCHFLKQILESLAAVLNSDDFPFFKPSLSLLEAELAPFKDWLVTVKPLKYEPVKSSASLKVWSHEGSNLYPKIGLKQGCRKGLQFFFKWHETCTFPMLGKLTHMPKPKK